MSAHVELPLVYVGATAKAKRKKLGGCRKDKFIDGWVEFGDKRIARRVAEALNNTPIGMALVLMISPSWSSEHSLTCVPGSTTQPTNRSAVQSILRR